MSCEQFQRLLHLSREGEISEKEAEALHRHLRLCEKCQVELHRIESADALLGMLGSFTPAPQDPEKLTADILRRVREESSERRAPGLIDRIADFFELPVIRYATLLTILLAVSVFAVQSVAMLGDISKLELRMASPTLRAGGSEATYTAQSSTLRSLATSKGGMALTESASITLVDGRVIAPVQDVDSFLSAHSLNSLPDIVNSASLNIDKETLNRIIDEVKATAEVTVRVGRQGV